MRVDIFAHADHELAFALLGVGHFATFGVVKLRELARLRQRKDNRILNNLRQSFNLIFVHLLHSLEVFGCDCHVSRVSFFSEVEDLEAAFFLLFHYFLSILLKPSIFFLLLLPLKFDLINTRPDRMRQKLVTLLRFFGVVEPRSGSFYAVVRDWGLVV